MGTDNKISDIHREIKQRIYDRLVESMTRLSSQTDGQLAKERFINSNVMQFMNWLADEQKPINLLKFNAPNTFYDDAFNVKRTQTKEAYIERRKSVMKGALDIIALEHDITLDEARSNVADFNRTIKTKREPMGKTQEA